MTTPTFIYRDVRIEKNDALGLMFQGIAQNPDDDSKSSPFVIQMPNGVIPGFIRFMKETFPNGMVRLEKPLDLREYFFEMKATLDEEYGDQKHIYAEGFEAGVRWAEQEHEILKEDSK